MSHGFDEEGTDGILLIDATNAFNQMNRAVAMHNLQLTCNKMSMYIINTYRSPSRLFICGGGEILSQEGTTQGDRLAMPWYSVNTAVIIQSLRLNIPEVKQVWLADDSAGGGRLVQLHNWYKYLEGEGKKYGSKYTCP
jgi:frataxin-like iron-binding protein CyaY